MSDRREVVRKYNELQLTIGGNQFMKCLFDGEDGWYYDAVGDEIFYVEKIGEGITADGEKANWYKIDHGDQIQTGALLDHGFNERLDE